MEGQRIMSAADTNAIPVSSGMLLSQIQLVLACMPRLHDESAAKSAVDVTLGALHRMRSVGGRPDEYTYQAGVRMNTYVVI